MKKTIEKLISELGGLYVGSLEIGSEIIVEEALRHVSVNITLPKDREQKRLEKIWRAEHVLMTSLKNEIARRLQVGNKVAEMKIDDFRNFLLVNFRIDGDRVERNKKLLMPSEITEKMLRSAAREADRRAGRYVAPEKKSKREK